MLKPFFIVAMQAPARHLAFRRMVIFHVLICTLGSYLASTTPVQDAVTFFGYCLLALALVEGAAVVGWRLTQLPKSPALEFLLTSPIQPRRLFAAEALVGVVRFTLIQLAGVPAVGSLIFIARIEMIDFYPLLFMPYLWGLLTGLAITAWLYEHIWIRRIGELLSIFGVLMYLVVGVIAAENLPMWFQQLPPTLGQFCYDGVRFAFDMNPFGVVRYWFSTDRVGWLAWERFQLLNVFAIVVVVLAGLRAAFRLRGHFHDRHYKPISSDRKSQSDKIGDQPLSWWAVRRVMEYSGRVNLYLAGGACLLYAVYLVAEKDWPAFMGRNVFQLFETWGGAPSIATAMVLMACVPAIFQFGLWDATVQARCQRLELLLLTDLSGRDYWNASLAASWRRGRGYFFSAGVLWVALGVSGRAYWPEVIAAMCAAAVMWCFLFVVGFRNFSRGGQSNGMSSLLILGTPLLLAIFLKNGLSLPANFLPAGLLYMPLTHGTTITWFVAFGVFATITFVLTRRGIAACESNLRAWYDLNQGLKSAE
jgi:hypothetical protein